MAQEIPGRSRRKVLILNWRDITNPRAGGAELHVWEIFSRAAQQDWDVTVICSHYRGAKRQEIVNGIKVIRYGGEFSFYWLWPIVFWRIVRQLQPDIVVEFINKLPFFLPLHTRISVLCFVHHLFGDAAHHEFPKPLAWLIKSTEALIPWVYRNNIFLTGAESTVAELAGLGLPTSNLYAVPYGVDVDAFKPGVKSDTPRIIFVGRLKKYKGIGDLLTVVANLRQHFAELKLDIVGHGDAREALEAQAQALGIQDAVMFHGFVDDATKVRLYQEAWLACLPSAKEGFGLTIPEAALCEVPTVGYDVCGVRDAIQNGQTGILVEWGNVSKLAAACFSLLENKSERIALGQAARERYQGFTWDKAATVMQTLIDSQCTNVSAIKNLPSDVPKTAQHFKRGPQSKRVQPEDELV